MSSYAISPIGNPAYNISQEQLVVAALRFSPNVVVVGEMRDTEASAAVEASLTGHTVVSTVHSGAAEAAHTRIALLCQRRFPIDFSTSLTQAGMAFPVIAYTHRLEDNSRRVMDISECEVLTDGRRTYHTLYRYDIVSNTVQNGTYTINGATFPKWVSPRRACSASCGNTGIPQDELARFTKIGD